ncbi:nickel-binding protein [Agromyces sp. NPDC055661]
MPYYIIERNYAEKVVNSPDGARELGLINDQESVRWLYSFLSVDRRKSYCVYEAPSPDAILAAAARAGIPADVIIEVDSIGLPNGTYAPVS